MTTRETWLAARRQGIGGSDAGVLLGCNPYSSLMKLYAEKIGALDPEPDSPRLRWGRRFERPILDEYEFATGLEVLDQDDVALDCRHEFEVGAGVVTMLRHPDCHVMIGNVDGVAFGDRRGIGIPDAKTVERRPFQQWLKDEQPPLTLQVQLQHYMEITGARWSAIVAFTGLSDPLYVYEMEADPGFAERLMEYEDTFWRRYVARRQPPPADKTAATGRALAALYPRDSGRLAMLNGPAEEWAAEYDELGGTIRMLEKRREGFKILLTAAIADASAGMLPDGSGYTYKAGKRGRVLRRASAKTMEKHK